MTLWQRVAQTEHLRLLQIGNNLKQIVGGRIPVRTKHLVKSFHMELGMRGELGKSNCGIDVITQQFFASATSPERRLSIASLRSPFRKAGSRFTRA